MAGRSMSFIRTNVDSGGTTQQISANFNNVQEAIFKAAYANAALLKIGLSAFTTHYLSLEPGQQLTLKNFDLSLLYVDGTTGDDLEVTVFL